MPDVQVRRIYEPRGEADGVRILVDGLWPRGLTRDAAAIDRWMKEVAPGAALRKWFGHEPERWEAFAERYRQELSDKSMTLYLEQLSELARQGNLTLVYAARDEARNQAVVLAAVLNARLRG
jgi:uncharacterized protein YeaO (DUF488 family)